MIKGRTRRNVLKLRPPLIAEPVHVDQFLEALDGSLSQVP